VRGPLRAWRQGGAPAGTIGEPRPLVDLVELLREHFARVPEHGYYQIGAYIAPTAARTELLQALQADLRDGTRVATTLGYGPRFLHSTGQLHKGGAPTGCFIQLTNGHPRDLEIPGRDESFGVLVDAQAMGDFAAFGNHELPALRIDLGDDPDAGLRELQAALAEALT
jgi:hypothetical protein